MLEIAIDTAGLNASLRILPGVLQAGQMDVLGEVGVYLQSEIRIDFEEKSRGRTSHGVKWKELTEERERQKARGGGWKGGPDAKPPKSQINVDKGLLRNSSTPGFASTGGKDLFDVRQDSVTVGYGMEYAKYVDELRPLIPDPAPKEWVEESEKIVAEWLEEELRKQLGAT